MIVLFLGTMRCHCCCLGLWRRTWLKALLRSNRVTMWSLDHASCESYHYWINFSCLLVWPCDHLTMLRMRPSVRISGRWPQLISCWSYVCFIKVWSYFSSIILYPIFYKDIIHRIYMLWMWCGDFLYVLLHVNGTNTLLWIWSEWWINTLLYMY